MIKQSPFLLAEGSFFHLVGIAPPFFKLIWKTCLFNSVHLDFSLDPIFR